MKPIYWHKFLSFVFILASGRTIKMNHCIVAKQNCYRYFKDEVLSRINSTFPHLRVKLLTFEYPGDYCNVYFGRDLRYSSGTLQMLYDGIEISVCPFDTGNRCQDHGGTVYTPTCIRGTLLMNDRLQRDKMLFWHSLADMVDAVKSFNGFNNKCLYEHRFNCELLSNTDKKNNYD